MSKLSDESDKFRNAVIDGEKFLSYTTSASHIENIIGSNMSTPTCWYSACDAPDELMSLAINAINVRKEAYKNNNKTFRFYDIEVSINSGGFSERQVKQLHYAIKAAKLEISRARAQIVFVKIITGADEE